MVDRILLSLVSFGWFLFLIDGDSLVYCVYHGLCLLCGVEGCLINALHGFVVMLLVFVCTEWLWVVLVCWDTFDVLIYRWELWLEY